MICMAASRALRRAFNFKRSRGSAIYLVLTITAVLTIPLIGCGGSSSPPPTNPDFSLNVQPNQFILPVGGMAQVQVSASSTSGFTGTISVTGSGLPSGVSESPTTFSLSSGQNQIVILNASSKVSTESLTLTWTGTSTSLTHTATASVNVENAPPVSSPTRTTFIRNDSTPIENTNGYPFALQTARYDPVTKNFFVSNTLLNRVEVYSATTEQLVVTIPVPAPVGMDFTVANDLLYVGTLTDYLFVIDPMKLQVVQRIASEVMLPGTTFNPIVPIVLSDGRVLMTTGLSVDGSTPQVIWNPATGTGQDVSKLFNENIGIMARSGDHSKVLLLPAVAANAFLYDAQTSTVLSVPATFGISIAAGNQDGSQWYVEGYGPVLAVLNGQLQQTAQSTIACCGSDMILSQDQQTLYTSVDGYNTAAFDATTLQYKGWISSVPVEGFIDAAELKDIDETGLILGMEDHGVAFLDASLTLNTGSSTTGFNFGYITPNNAPLNTPTAVTMEVLAGANSNLSTPTVYFGPNNASNVSLSNLVINATAPAWPFAGPVNVFTSQSNGNLAIVPDGFSYGPTLVYEPTNASVADGGGPADFFTFGAGSSTSSIQFGFGASTGTVNSINPGYAYIPYAFLNLQDLEVTVPQGNAGSVGLSLQAPSGSVNLPNGFRYYPALQLFPLSNPGLQQGSYDPTRNRIYFTNVDHVEVFDTLQQSWSSPITLPNGKSARSLQSISLSPDGSTLAIGDTANKSILALDPDQPTNVTEYPSGTMLGPTSVSTVNGAVYFWACGPSSAALRKLNLSTGTTTALNLTCSEPHDRLSATTDGSEVFAYTAGSLYSVNTADDKVTLLLFAVAVADTGDMAITGDGTHSVTAGEIIDENFYLASAITYLDAAIIDVSATYGIKWYPTGSLILQPLTHQLDVIDGNIGLLRDRVSLPVTVANAFDASVVDTVDNSLFLITSEGIAELSLSSLPVGVGSVMPSSGSTSGGLTVTVQGNGFDSSTQVQLDGSAIATTVIDNQTLTFVTPAHVAAGVELSVQNSTGQAYALQDAFTFISSPSQGSPAKTAHATKHPARKDRRSLTVVPARNRLTIEAPAHPS